MLFNRSFVLVLVSLTLFGLATAQKPVTTPTPERSREIAALLNDARLAAPELAVDTFLKIVESKKVTDPAWKREIVDEALRLADDVKYPVRMRPVPIPDVILNNTEAYLLAIAYSQKLDRMSLKSRAIDQIVEYDRDRAKQLIFEMGGRLGLKPRTCSDTMTYEVSDIYLTVGKVAKAVFDDKQIADGQRALFVAAWVDEIESPVQIAPAIDLVRQFLTSTVERQILLTALSNALRRNFNDDRTFTSAAGWGGGPGPVLGKIISAEPDLVRSDLSLAYRDFLLRNLRDTRCKENEIKSDDALPAFVETANKMFPEKPIAIDDIVTTDVGGPANAIDMLSRSNDLKQIRTELIALTGAGPADDPTDFDKTDIEWQSKVSAFADKIPAWKPAEDIPDVDLFNMRSTLHGALAQVVPDGELKRTIVRKWLRFLAGSSVQKENYIRWSVELRMVRAFTEKGADLFAEIAPEFSNQNFKVMLAAKKLLDQPEKAKSQTSEGPAKPPKVPTRP